MKSRTSHNILAAFTALLCATSAIAADATYTVYTATGASDASWVMTLPSTASVNFGGGDTTFGGTSFLGTTVNLNQTYRAAGNYTMYYSVPNVSWANNASVFYPSDPTVSLLNEGAFIDSNAGQVIDIAGLTIGQQYTAKMVFADSRAGAAGLTMAVTTPNSTSANTQYAYADGKYLVVTATWTANTGTQSFQPVRSGVAANGQLNAIQVVAVPEPSTWAFFGVVGVFAGGYLLRRRRLS